MSARSRDLPRRSCLSTPGSNEKFLAKAPTVPADMTFLDLEDAVAPLEKEGARPKVVDAIKNLPWDDRVLCVRVNAWDTEWTYGDVIEVVSFATEPSQIYLSTGTQTYSCDVPAGRGICTFPLSLGSISAVLLRDGVVVGAARSNADVTATPYVQDLQYRVVGGLR